MVGCAMLYKLKLTAHLDPVDFVSPGREQISVADAPLF